MRREVKFVIGYTIAAGIVCSKLLGCAHLSAQDKLELTEYEAQQGACIAATPKDTAAVDACRARVKAEWCTKWRERFGQEMCP